MQSISALLLLLCTPAIGRITPAVPPGTLSCAPIHGGDDDARQRAIDAIQRGEYEEARRLLDGLIVERDVARAREALAAGRGEEAMGLLDEALDLGGETIERLELRGRAALVAAEALAAKPGNKTNPQWFYQDALEFFLQAGSHAVAAGDEAATIRLAFEASGAARRVPDPERALELARMGSRRLEAFSGEGELILDPPAARVHAEAAFDRYIAARRGGESGDEFYQEAEDQLMLLLGEHPTDPWPPLQLSNLYQWKGDNEAAIGVIEHALEVSPERQALHDRLQSLVPAQRGWVALTEFYGRFSALHPESATVQRAAGIAALFGALADFDQGNNDPEPFRVAEASFARAAELGEELRSDCLGYQAICRDAVGWCLFNQGDYSAAKEAFLSMEDVFEGGLRWQLPGRLPDGVAGLGLVIAKLAANPQSVEATDQVAEAAAIADYLFAYFPEDGNHANNAGFLNRDAAVLFERTARILRGRAAEAADAQERRKLEEDAAHAMDRAFELMAKSKAAYKVAARLLPDDVRVINDAALVVVYYTRDEVEYAEDLLLRAVKLGEEQLADPGLDPERRFALNEAFGDAHQNLAVLELTLRRNGAKARQWLERALEIGPPSREQRRPLLDICDAVAADPDFDLSSSPMIRNMVWLHSPRR